MTVQKCPCGKDAYSSEHEARVKCRNMGNRFRVYPCGMSDSYHVTKQFNRDGINLDRKKRASRKRMLHGE